MKPVVWSRPGAAAVAGIVVAWLASIELGSSRTASRDAAVAGGSGETVIDTGPYRRVRHPLYLATMGVFAGVGAVFGNWVSVTAAAVPASALAHRIAVEERMLVEHLGTEYRSYRNRTHRLLPGVW